MGHQPNNEQGDFRRGRLFWKPTLQNVLVATIFIHVSGPFFGEEHIYSNNSTLKMIPILWKIKSNDILQDLTLVELCAQRKRRGDTAAQGKCSNRTPRNQNPQKKAKKILLSTEADPPPAYSRRASEAEPAPADCPPSYTRARWALLTERSLLGVAYS